MFKYSQFAVFQSTFPLQGTTECRHKGGSGRKYFNPRSHCRERRHCAYCGSDLEYISIHVPIAGNDLSGLTRTGQTLGISIHVPIAGNDNGENERKWLLKHFNPRSHCRERHNLIFPPPLNTVFQSTFPLQGTTDAQNWNPVYEPFQSTFPLQGTTVYRVFSQYRRMGFQSTFPLQGTTTGDYAGGNRMSIFQSTFPLQGTTIRVGPDGYAWDISIHVPIAGNDGCK